MIRKSTEGGFTLIETLVGMGIFAIVATSLYFAYANVLDVITIARFNTTSMAIMSEQAEIIRNMKYEDIGILNGSPPGKIIGARSVTVDGLSVTLNTYIRNIDDPFDGTIGGAPNDLSPADYKLVEMDVTCTICGNYNTPSFTTTVAPKNLESTSNNGSIFIGAIDANGDPVTGANVSVSNTAVSPSIFINDTTATNGELQLVDTATSSQGYHITVSKPGYSTDRTYTPGDAQNPNPLKPHATVAKQQLTRITFQIDRTSTINFQALDKFCKAIPSIDFAQTGVKPIGIAPDVLKFSGTFSTNENGQKNDAATEWDTYTFTNTDDAYQISGSTFQNPLVVNPATIHNLTWLMEPKVPNALAVSVKTAGGQPIPDASVQLSRTGFSETKLSGRRQVSETDWSAAGYSNKSAGVDPDSQPGTVTLLSLGGYYATSSQEWIESETIDFGPGSNTNFLDFSWNPTAQPAQTELKFQIAANNDGSTWNFVGPDGSSSTYYTVPGTQMWSGLNNNQYLRYKAYLYTDDKNATPNLDDMTLTFSSGCIPGDYASFSGLANDTYTLTITKSGYQQFTDNNVLINGTWQEYKATLLP